MTQTVTVLRPDVVQDYNREIADYDNVTPHQVPGCLVMPLSTDERMANGNDYTAAARQVLLPEGADVARLDAMLVPGDDVRWFVRGEPQPWPSPTGGLAHVSLIIDRTRGSDDG